MLILREIPFEYRVIKHDVHSLELSELLGRIAVTVHLIRNCNALPLWHSNPVFHH
jgi:hypothetical protein